MKIGMIARGEDRGLGTMLWEFYRHVRPAKTLLVVPDGVQKAGLTTHVERFPDSMHARFGPLRRNSLGTGTLDERTCREFLDGLDVLYTAETFYDWRMVRWAEEQGVATVCHVMPEFARPEWFDQPTVIWAPTRYRMDHMPDSARHVPVPIATDRFVTRASPDVPVRWLHVAGAQTIADRNGTLPLLRALRFLEQPTTVTITTQTPLDGALSAAVVPSHVDLRVVSGSVQDYWTLYRHGNAFVMPRRYAGLCLPALEAMGAGMAVLMSDMSPQNEEWPVATVPVTLSEMTIMGNRVEVGDVDSLALAQRMDVWAKDPDRFTDAVERSVDYAVEHSWTVARKLILDELEMAVSRARRTMSA